MREVLQNILNEFDIPMKIVGLVKMCLNETYIKNHMGKNLMQFLFRMVSNKEMLYQCCFPTLLYNMLSERSKIIRKDWN
jgi:hypothetical protein